MQTRQVAVEDKDVVVVDQCPFQAARPVERDIDRHLRAPQAGRHHLCHLGLVLDHEHAHMDLPRSTQTDTSGPARIAPASMTPPPFRKRCITQAGRDASLPQGPTATAPLGFRKRRPCRTALMLFFTYLRLELRHRLRQAVFIAAGLAVGIALVITVSAVAAGTSDAQAGVLHGLYGIGTDMTVTRPYATGDAGPRAPGQSGRAPGLPGHQPGPVRRTGRGHHRRPARGAGGDGGARNAVDVHPARRPRARHTVQPVRPPAQHPGRRGRPRQPAARPAQRGPGHLGTRPERLRRHERRGARGRR